MIEQPENPFCSNIHSFHCKHSSWENFLSLSFTFHQADSTQSVGLLEVRGPKPLYFSPLPKASTEMGRVRNKGESEICLEESEKYGGLYVHKIG